MLIRLIGVLTAVGLALPVTAQILIAPTVKATFTQDALNVSGSRPDPFAKPVGAQIVPVLVVEPPPKLSVMPRPSKMLQVSPTPIALSVNVKGFVVASGTPTLAILSREGSTDFAQVGDTILSAQVVAISPMSRTVTLSENGKYIVRALEATP
ncbi:hypothetical protein [Candidatus Cyanaurora vandensis]|uniref:hypothetical protein n=1 Tax=Candidatus Cyanaurora vandensis TaxID=2714958 RepID=UPI00257E8174|nr:hypothetical protein [Candidatus Cyanaurora vandensis]